MTAIDRAWNTLEEIGAIDQAGKLTALGKYIVGVWFPISG